MTARHAGAAEPGARLVVVGALLFAAGLVGALLVVVPFLMGRADAPLWTTLLASVMPVGLGLALLGLLRGARRRR